MLIERLKSILPAENAAANEPHNLIYLCSITRFEATLDDLGQSCQYKLVFFVLCCHLIKIILVSVNQMNKHLNHRVGLYFVNRTELFSFQTLRKFECWELHDNCQRIE
jgi:hypothetical protein